MSFLPRHARCWMSPCEALHGKKLSLCKTSTCAETAAHVKVLAAT